MPGVRETYEKLKLWEKVVFHGLIIVGLAMVAVGLVRIIKALAIIF